MLITLARAASLSTARRSQALARPAVWRAMSTSGPADSGSGSGSGSRSGADSGSGRNNAAASPKKAAGSAATAASVPKTKAPAPAAPAAPASTAAAPAQTKAAAVKPAAAAPAVASNAAPAEEPAVQHDMTLEEWSPRTAVKKNLGRFFKLPDSFMAKLAGLSPNVSLQFKLAGSPSLMLRESTLDLVQRVEAEGAKEACTTSFILDGSRGSGKSSTLLQTSSLLKSKGWIVILVPRMSQWTSGVEPYEKAASGDLYVQPVLAAKFLQLMMDWNAAAFAKIPAGNGSKQTIADVALAGIAKIDTAQTAVETVFSALFAAKDRAPVLLALDQIGAIYRTTSYFSSESKPLTADQFALPALIHKTLATLGQSRTAIVGAVDRTESLVSSRYFKYALKNMSPMNQSHGLLLSQVGTLDLASRDEFGVILPEYLDPTHSDAFSKSNKNPPKHLSRFVVPPYTKDEVAKALEFYKDNQVLFSDISDKLVAKRFMLTQGNPLGVFDSCVSL